MAQGDMNRKLIIDPVVQRAKKIRNKLSLNIISRKHQVGQVSY